MRIATKELEQSLRVIRTAQVRDEHYAAAEKILIYQGQNLATCLKPLLRDSDVVVRHRAADLLRKARARRQHTA